MWENRIGLPKDIITNITRSISKCHNEFFIYNDGICIYPYVRFGKIRVCVVWGSVCVCESVLTLVDSDD